MSYKYYFGDAPPENDKRFAFKGLGDVERPRRKLSLSIAVYDAKNRRLENARELTAELTKLKIHLVCVQNPSASDYRRNSCSRRSADFTRGNYGRILFSQFKKFKLGSTTVLLVNAEKNHDESVHRYRRERWRRLNERLIFHHYDCFPNKARTIVAGSCPSLGGDASFRELAHGGHGFGEESMYTDELTLFCMHHRLKMANTFAENLQTPDDREFFLTKHIDAVELRYVSVCNLRLLVMDACVETDRFDFDYIPRQVAVYFSDEEMRRRRGHYKRTLTKLGLSKVMSDQRQFVRSKIYECFKSLSSVYDTNGKHALQDSINDLLTYHY